MIEHFYVGSVHRFHDLPVGGDYRNEEMVFHALKKLLAFAVFPSPRSKHRPWVPKGRKEPKSYGIRFHERLKNKFGRFHNPSFSADNVEMGWLAAWMDAADLAGRLSEPRRAMYLQAVCTSTQARQITAIHAPYDSTSQLSSTHRI